MNNNIKQTYPVNIFIGEDEYNFTLLYKIEKGPFKDTEFNILNKTSCGTNAKFTAEEICKRYNQYPDIMRENEELKARCETYKKDYDSMVAEVLRLSGENSELLEALKSTRSLNLSLHEQDTVGNRVYKKVESAITKATK